jgi:hypothetical protein
LPFSLAIVLRHRPALRQEALELHSTSDIGLLELNSSRVKMIMDAEYKYPRLRRDPNDRHSGTKTMTEKRATSSGRKIGKIVGIVGGALSKAKPSPCLGAPGSAKPPR